MQESDVIELSILMPCVNEVKTAATCIENGYDAADELVKGNRFLGGLEPGAMRPLHIYLGNLVLAAVGGSRVSEVLATHLCSWGDGWSHLRLLLVFSLRWLILVPGTVSLAIGDIGFDVASPVSLQMILGIQTIMAGMFLGVLAVLLKPR